MNPCELTMGVTAVANVIAGRLSDDELSLAAAVLTQLGDTLAVISVQRALCSAPSCATKTPDANAAAV